MDFPEVPFDELLGCDGCTCYTPTTQGIVIVINTLSPLFSNNLYRPALLNLGQKLSFVDQPLDTYKVRLKQRLISNVGTHTERRGSAKSNGRLKENLEHRAGCFHQFFKFRDSCVVEGGPSLHYTEYKVQSSCPRRNTTVGIEQQLLLCTAKRASPIRHRMEC